MKHKYIITIIIGLISLFSCEDEMNYTETTSNSKEEVFSSFSRTAEFVTDIYGRLDFDYGNFDAAMLASASTARLCTDLMIEPTIKITMRIAAIAKMIKGNVCCLKTSALDKRGRRFAFTEGAGMLKTGGASSGEFSIETSYLFSSISCYHLSVGFNHYTSKMCKLQEKSMK